MAMLVIGNHRLYCLGLQVRWQLWFAINQVCQQVLKRLSRRRPAHCQHRIADLPRLPGLQSPQRNIYMHQHPVTDVGSMLQQGCLYALWLGAVSTCPTKGNAPGGNGLHLHGNAEAHGQSLGDRFSTRSSPCRQAIDASGRPDS
jgi:hypothetical protein